MKHASLHPAVDDFLATTGWAGGRVELLAADASFRRYFRVTCDDRTAVLMDAPPDKEDSKPFLAVDHYLNTLGLNAPDIYMADLNLGLMLVEDFGDDRLGPYLAQQPEYDLVLYGHAVQVLTHLQAQNPPADLPYQAACGGGSVSLKPYDAEVLLREARLMIEWFLPATGIMPTEKAERRFETAWLESLSSILEESQKAPVMVLRDYHADNLMVLKNKSTMLGLIDFQDALCGHPAYDVASLLQDIRRDVSPALETAMLDMFISTAPTRLGIQSAASFLQSYHILGAQRNTKIIGIFTRLCQRDAKPGYLQYLPKLWQLLERSLVHPALAPVQSWFLQHVPHTHRKLFSA